MALYPLYRPHLSIQTTTPPPPVNTAPTLPEYSAIISILTCFLCLIICTVGLFGLVRWTCLKQPSSSLPITTDESVLSESWKKKIVDSLPRLVFKSADNVEVCAECVICLSEFVNAEEIRVLPNCGHVFHVGCIDTWLIGSHSLDCPSCRQVLVVGSPSPPLQLPEADYLP